jgi:hypothetical protein
MSLKSPFKKVVYPKVIFFNIIKEKKRKEKKKKKKKKERKESAIYIKQDLLYIYKRYITNTNAVPNML